MGVIYRSMREGLPTGRLPTLKCDTSLDPPAPATVSTVSILNQLCILGERWGSHKPVRPLPFHKGISLSPAL